MIKLLSIIKLNSLLLGCAFMLSSQLLVNSQETISDLPIANGELCEIENSSWQAGEKITYNLYYNLNFIWLKAGEVTFEVKENEDYFHITALGTTANTFTWFFDVNDRYESYIDKHTLKPIKSIRDVQEGNYTKISEADFDYENNIITGRSGKKKDRMKDFDFSFNNCMHDVLSIVYFARNIDYEQVTEGQNFPTQLLLDDDMYDVRFRYAGKESKRIKRMGKYKTLKLIPNLIAGDVFNEGDEMTVWATDDQNRLPLMIESPVSIGTVKVTLKSYENLKYPITSKL